MSDNFDNQLECAHCGTSFYYELTRCPNCGVNIYQPEEDPDDSITWVSEFINSFRIPLGILAGWLVTGLISLALYIPVRFAFTAPQSGYVVYTVLVGCISIGGFAGGFLAFRIAQQRAILATVLVGLSGIGINSMVLLREWGSLLPFTGVILGWIIIVAAAMGGANSAQAMLRKVQIDTLFVVHTSEENLYQSLFIKVGYDHDIAKRLIEFERRQAPQATRSEWIRSAIQRWERDNR